MNGINHVILLGRLGQDIILQQTKTGHFFVDFKIATNHPVQRNNQWITETDWHAVRFWNKQAETCAKFLSKGDPVAIEGSLRTDSWQNKDGELRVRNFVLGRELHLLPKNRPQASKGLPALPTLAEKDTKKASA